MGGKVKMDKEAAKVSGATVAVRLRAARREREMSQQAVAEAIGTTQGRVSNWETGLRRPALFNAEKWAGVFDFTLVEDEVGRRTLVPRG